MCQLQPTITSTTCPPPLSSHPLLSAIAPLVSFRSAPHHQEIATIPQTVKAVTQQTHQSKNSDRPHRVGRRQVPESPMTHTVHAIALPSPTVPVSPKMEGLFWLYIGFSDIFHMLFQIRFFRFTCLRFSTSPLDLEHFYHYPQHSSYSTLSYLTSCTL